jgi:hypothetical protein
MLDIAGVVWLTKGIVMFEGFVGIGRRMISGKRRISNGG